MSDKSKAFLTYGLVVLLISLWGGYLVSHAVAQSEKPSPVPAELKPELNNIEYEEDHVGIGTGPVVFRDKVSNARIFCFVVNFKAVSCQLLPKETK